MFGSGSRYGLRPAVSRAPGGFELLVIGLMLTVLAVPLALIGVVYLYGKRRGWDESTDGGVADRVE